MMPYIFQAVLAALLVFPVMADEEWETQQTQQTLRHSGLNGKL
jgi:hypothetical protein